MQKLCMSITEDLKRRLEAEAMRDMRSQRAVMMLALEAYLKAREQASAESATMVSMVDKDDTPDVSK